MPCQHVMAPVTGTGLPQAAETVVTARASPRLEPAWQALGRHVMGASARRTAAFGGDRRDGLSLRTPAASAVPL